MKSLIIALLTLLSTSAHARIDKAFTIQVIEGDAQIRHGFLFEEPIFTPFNIELQVKLARAGVEVTQNTDTFYTDALLKYDYSMDRNTFYSLFPKAHMKANLTFINERKVYMIVEFNINCGYEVNDGGNQTLKMSCVNKMAKTVEKLLKENSMK